MSLVVQKILILLVVIGLFVPSMAQNQFNVGLNFMTAFPQDEFKDNVDQVGFGGSLDFVYRLSESPLGVGAYIAYLVYGSETRREPFSLTIPDVVVDVTTTNSIILGHLLFRVQPGRGSVQPYVDGMLGFTLLSTDTRIEDVDDDDEIASSNNMRDTAFSYGFGGGLKVRVHEFDMGDNEFEEKMGTLFIDIGVRYIRGGEAEYRKEGSQEVKRSDTPLVTGHLGVSMAF